MAGANPAGGGGGTPQGASRSQVLRVVFRKELIDAFRDRRSLASALLFPLLMPILISVMFQLLVDREGPTARVSLPVVGREHAPALIEHLEQQGIDVETAGPDAARDPQAAVERSRAEAVLVIPERFPEAFRKGRPSTLQLYFDDSRSDSRRVARRAQRGIGQYSQRIGSLRLIARGVSPSLTQPISVEEHDLSTPNKLTARLLSLIPMLALMACFIGSMQVAIDATAGERERGSLEPLLINPVSRSALSAGKWLTAALFGAISCSLTLALSIGAMSLVDLQKLGLHFELTWQQGASMWLILLPLCLLASASQMLIATFARSYKEAQTYLSLVLFLPMLPSLVLSLSPVDTQLWMLFVPVLAQTQLLTDAMAGGPRGASSILLSQLVTTAASLLCLVAAARLLNSERIVFGR